MTVIKIFDRSLRHGLCTKKPNDASYCNALAACSVVCRPKRHGGLGITNVELENQDILPKQRHIFYFFIFLFFLQ
jgi:hypothetical protein